MSSYRLHDSLGYRLSIAARLQERRFEEGLRSLGLTRTTWAIMLGVGIDELSRPSDLARFIGIDRTAVSRALRAMEQQGLIERTSGKTDRRTTDVELTDLGRARLEAGLPHARANNAAMMDKLSKDEVATLKRLLGRLIEGERTDLPNL